MEQAVPPIQGSYQHVGRRPIAEGSRRGGGAQLAARFLEPQHSRHDPQVGRRADQSKRQGKPGRRSVTAHQGRHGSWQEPDRGQAPHPDPHQSRRSGPGREHGSHRNPEDQQDPVGIKGPGCHHAGARRRHRLVPAQRIHHATQLCQATAGLLGQYWERRSCYGVTHAARRRIPQGRDRDGAGGGNHRARVLWLHRSRGV